MSKLPKIDRWTREDILRAVMTPREYLHWEANPEPFALMSKQAQNMQKRPSL